MAFSLNAINWRNLSLGPDEKILFANPDEATDEELRKIIIHFIESTSAQQHLIRCPFRVLNTLSHATYVSLVAGLNRAPMLSLLKTESECQGRQEKNARHDNDRLYL